MFNPGIKAPAIQITKVFILGVSLFFKTNIKIGSMVVLEPDQVDQVITQVKQVKWYDQQFYLLVEMDLFMVDQYGIAHLLPVFK